LLRNKKEKQDNRPTEEEFLRYRPFRADIKWKEDPEGIVQLKVTKFKSNFGKSFLNLIKKDNHFTANMDKLGSIIWKNCDGIKTVEDILKILEKTFPDQKNINQRLYLFLQNLNNLGYIELR
jgi:hypothetical protein